MTIVAGCSVTTKAYELQPFDNGKLLCSDDAVAKSSRGQ